MLSQPLFTCGSVSNAVFANVHLFGYGVSVVIYNDRLPRLYVFKL